MWRRVQADRLTDWETETGSFHPSEPQGPDLQDGNDSKTNDLGPWCPKCMPRVGGGQLGASDAQRRKKGRAQLNQGPQKGEP